MKANPAITSFNAGLLSPLLGGRPDLEKWQSGLSRCDNLIPRVQGALQRAAGSVFVGAVKDSASAVGWRPSCSARPMPSCSSSVPATSASSGIAGGW